METRTMQTKRVLIVDDEPYVTMTLASILEKLGDAYMIDTTNTSDDVLLKFQHEDYALMITDYKMPGMDGIDLAKAVQNISPQTHIILMTAYGSSALAETAKKDLRLDGYLDKPFTVAQIREMVTDTLNESTISNRVLILEDNADVSRLYERALTRRGYEVHTAATLNEARVLIDRYHFTVFLCDIHIGRKRGTDLLRQCKQKLSDDKTHIIMITADASYRSDAEEIGIDFYLEKPIAIETLTTLIARLTTRQ